MYDNDILKKVQISSSIAVLYKRYKVIDRPINYRMNANLKLPILHLELVFLNR
jgi:hypothetical protein